LVEAYETKGPGLRSLVSVDKKHEINYTSRREDVSALTPADSALI
jgi:hypothetical protein